MKQFLLLPLALSLAFLVSAKAAHSNIATSIDGIDYYFALGGGSVLVNVAPGNDSWTVFAANAGDIVTISTTAGSISDTVLALFWATGNGIVNTGDVFNLGGGILDPSFSLSPVPVIGTDLTLVAFDDDSGSGLLSLITYALPSGGHYAIYAQSFEELVTGNFTISLSGNTADIVRAPDTGATVGLMGLSLACLALVRRKLAV